MPVVLRLPVRLAPLAKLITGISGIIGIIGISGIIGIIGIKLVANSKKSCTFA